MFFIQLSSVLFSFDFFSLFDDGAEQFMQIRHILKCFRDHPARINHGVFHRKKNRQAYVTNEYIYLYKKIYAYISESCNISHRRTSHKTSHYAYFIYAEIYIGINVGYALPAMGQDKFKTTTIKKISELIDLERRTFEFM